MGEWFAEKESVNLETAWDFIEKKVDESAVWIKAHSSVLGEVTQEEYRSYTSSIEDIPR